MLSFILLRHSFILFLAASLMVTSFGFPRVAAADQPGLVSINFVYESAPFPECHASTIEESKDGLVAAWFGGTAEKNPDVGIWVSRLHKGVWSPPMEVANGVWTNGMRYPTWNPVLFQPSSGPLVLFYKVGPSPSTWWGMMMTSGDHGKTWSKPIRLQDGIYGPIKNKPVEDRNGTWIAGSSTEDDGWRVHFEWTRDGGRTWGRTEALNDGRKLGAIQPALTFDGGQTFQAWCRTRQGKIFTTSSQAFGRLWSELLPTTLPNPNSGIDVVRLRNSSSTLLIYNHTSRGRSPLNLAVSTNGSDWNAVLVLESEPGEYSYPAIIQSRDGKVHATWTWKRKRIRHAVIDPVKLELHPIVDGVWP